MSKRMEYRKKLAKLPMKVDEEIFGCLAADLFPHEPGAFLSPEGLYSALKKRIAIAVPSLVFRGENLSLELRDGILDVSTFEGTFSDEAKNYAEHEWHDELKSGQKMQGVKIYLMDPRSLAVEKCFYVILDRLWTILKKDTSKPRSVIVNEAIVEASFDKLAFLELKKLRRFVRVPVFYHCSYCGCGFDDRLTCKGCGERFAFDQEDFWQAPPSLGCALPGKVVDLLNDGLGDGYFVIDPMVFRNEEIEKWAEAHSPSVAEAKK